MTDSSKAMARVESVVGLDISDRKVATCELSMEGEVVRRETLATTRAGLSERFGEGSGGRRRVVLEAGQHSPWVSRHLESLGHEVLVVNPHRMQLIGKSIRKSDRSDAEMLARMGRLDTELLSQVKHRRATTQRDRAIIQARAMLVSSRTAQIHMIRDLVKTNGFAPLPVASATENFVKTVEEAIPEELRPAMEGLLAQVESLTESIKKYDRLLDGMLEKYPVAKRLAREIPGVGPVIALTFVVTLEDSARFAKSRDVGAYLGLVPKQRESGNYAPELHITKHGDRYLRSMLVQGAHHIISRGPECDLRTWAEGHSGTSKSQRKRTVVAVARKLAVLMHRLWVSGETYDPFYQRKRREEAEAKRTEEPVMSG